MNVQKRLAAQVMKCSPHNVVFDTENLEDIEEAITKEDIRELVRKGIITKRPLKNTSRYHARKIRIQKSKGRRKGYGSRKGKNTTRTSPKLAWMNKVRLQRGLLKNLKAKGLLNSKVFRELYLKSKGGFFRSKRHMMLYIREKIIAK